MDESFKAYKPTDVWSEADINGIIVTRLRPLWLVILRGPRAKPQRTGGSRNFGGRRRICSLDFLKVLRRQLQ